MGHEAAFGGLVFWDHVTRKPRRTNVYVDGFNLYYGSLQDTKHKWLNLVALAQRLLPDEQIQRVRYFSARVSGSASDPSSPARQGKYLRALDTLPEVTCHLGTFLSEDVKMRLAPPPDTGEESWIMYLRPKGKRYAWVTKTEEKGSDVNLATALLVDAFDGDMEYAVVISNDSDLMEPIRVVRARQCAVGVVNPHSRHGGELAQVASWHRPLFTSYLRQSQFPDTLTDERGDFSKPAGW